MHIFTCFRSPGGEGAKYVFLHVFGSRGGQSVYFVFSALGEGPKYSFLCVFGPRGPKVCIFICFRPRGRAQKYVFLHVFAPLSVPFGGVIPKSVCFITSIAKSRKTSCPVELDIESTKQGRRHAAKRF